jgi:hypothetical protein
MVDAGVPLIDTISATSALRLGKEAVVVNWKTMLAVMICG